MPTNSRGFLIQLLVATMISTTILDMILVHNRVLTNDNHGSNKSINMGFESALASYYANPFAPRSRSGMTMGYTAHPEHNSSSIGAFQSQPKTNSKVDFEERPTSSLSLASLSNLHPSSSGEIIRIAVFPVVKKRKRKANYRHLIEDGVNQSPFLEFAPGGDELELISLGLASTSDEDDDDNGNVVWLLDLLAMRDYWGSDWCETFGDLLQNAIEIRKDLKKSLTWPIVVVDNRDYAYISYCRHIEEAVGPDNVRYSYRSLVTKRAWSKRKEWVRMGKTIDVRSQAPKAKYEHRHRPIGVRTDTVRAVHEYLQERGQKLCNDIEKSLSRNIDVSYFWETRNYTREDSWLRDKVYDVLLQFADMNPKYDIQVGLKGETAMWGRKSVSDSYVEALLDSKIVVVAQRDYWEDHYRLFEAMVAGTMVMTDKMLSLPTGLQDGVSVVEYTSSEDLVAKLKYYLGHHENRVEIARNGRYVAMSRHRSWHHMEEIVFGSPATVCRNKPEEGGVGEFSKASRCPYMVNAKNIDEPC